MLCDRALGFEPETSCARECPIRFTLEGREASAFGKLALPVRLQDFSTALLRVCPGLPWFIMAFVSSVPEASSDGHLHRMATASGPVVSGNSDAHRTPSAGSAGRAPNRRLSGRVLEPHAQQLLDASVIGEQSSLDVIGEFLHNGGV
jgi:hypothetical protein